MPLIAGADLDFILDNMTYTVCFIPQSLSPQALTYAGRFSILTMCLEKADEKAALWPGSRATCLV